MLSHYLKAIVVDDEEPSRKALVNYLNEFCKEIFVVDECNSADSAYKSISRNNPHIVFLDVEMPKGSGIDLLKRFRSISFKVIFVTAYSKYAVQAFRYAATDFLLKPVKVSELQEAVCRAKSDVEDGNYKGDIDQLLKGVSDFYNQSQGRIAIPDSQGFKVLDTEKIIMCQADTCYTIFFVENTRNVTAPYHLKHYEQQLSSTQFLRVHKSYLVNLQHVRGLQNNVIQLSKKLCCPLGTKYREEFKRRFVSAKR